MTLDVRPLLAEGVDQGVFLRAAVAVYQSGKLVLCDGTHDRNDVFDVASLTKVATAALALKHFDPDARLSVSGTVRNLLSHHTGLPAWRPFYAAAAQMLRKSVPQIIADERLHIEAKRIVRMYLSIIRPDDPKTLYSDLNFLLLGFALETMLGHPLPIIAQGSLFGPLGLNSMLWGGEHPDAVATAKGRPRPGNPVIEPRVSETPEGPISITKDSKLAGLVERFERMMPPPMPTDAAARDRAVDDDNAAIMGGTAGHAGLWSNAANMAKLGDALRICAEAQSDNPVPAERARLMFTPAGGGRTFGLDLPTGDMPAIGSILGRGAKGAAGHLGFTGCSLWIDRDAELSIAFLSNAVAVERPNPRIRAFRPKLHDAIAWEFAPVP